MRKPFRRRVRTRTACSSARLTKSQHGLTRDPDSFGGFAWHRNWVGVVDEQPAELVGDADAPWCARSEFFAGDEPIVEPSMQCGRS